MTTAEVANCTIEIEQENPGFEVTLTPRQGEEEGILYLDFRITAEEPTRPNPITLHWQYPVINVHQRSCALPQPKLCGMGRPRTRCSAAHDAPVWSMFDYAGDNSMTFAVADAINTCELSAQHAEETGCLTCRIELFLDPVPPLTEYSTTIRFDTRPLKYYDILTRQRYFFVSPLFA